MDGGAFVIIVWKTGKINWKKQKRQTILGRCRDSQRQGHKILVTLISALRRNSNLFLKEMAGCSMVL